MRAIGDLMNKKISNSLIHSLKGFTLLELSIVILIVGILAIPIFRLYESYLLRKEMIVTRDNVEMAVTGLALAINRSPCPSDRSIPEGAPNYGVEQCNLGTIPPCTDAGLQGICLATSTFDRDLDGNLDQIIIGGVPLFYLEGLGLKKVDYMDGSSILDGWNNKLTYAVSANITPPGRNIEVVKRDFAAGVISAIDENGNPTAGINGNALFVVVSHGKDGRGAFNKSGVANDNCLPGPSLRGENCDEDTTFMQGIALSDGADPFDDISKFFLSPEGELWTSTGTQDAQGRAQPHLRNMNDDNVGINIATPPTQKLQVGGVLRADSVRTDNICDEDGNNCFSAETLFGTGMPISAGTGSNGVCNTGQIITAISNGSIQCGWPTFAAPPGATSRMCPSGSYIQSILTDSCIVCNDGCIVCNNGAPTCL